MSCAGRVVVGGSVPCHIWLVASSHVAGMGVEWHYMKKLYSHFIEHLFIEQMNSPERVIGNMTNVMVKT